MREKPIFWPQWLIWGETINIEVIQSFDHKKRFMLSIKAARNKRSGRQHPGCCVYYKCSWSNSSFPDNTAERGCEKGKEREREREKSTDAVRGCAWWRERERERETMSMNVNRALGCNGKLGSKRSYVCVHERGESEVEVCRSASLPPKCLPYAWATLHICLTVGLILLFVSS